jgi:hypothetical protein
MVLAAMGPPHSVSVLDSYLSTYCRGDSPELRRKLESILRGGEKAAG